MDIRHNLSALYLAIRARTPRPLLLWGWHLKRRVAGGWHRLTLVRSYIANVSRLARHRFEARGTNRPLIAIALIEHLGDIVAAQPIARYLRQRHPNARLLWIARPPFDEVPRAFAEVDDVVPVQCISEWALLRDSRLFSSHYDLHVNLRECPVCRRPVARKTGNEAITTKNYFEYGNLLSVMCQNAGIEMLSAGPELHMTQDVVSKISRLALPQRFVVIHTRSNESAKDWLDAKWQEFVQRLLEETSVDIVEVGLRRTVYVDSPRVADLCGELSILETAEVVRRAALFIGVDSGPAHLANAVGTPGVVLKGAYRAFATYMPYSGRYASDGGAAMLTAGGSVSNITVDDVLTAAKARLA